MHALIGVEMVIGPDNDNIFFYRDDPREPMKSDDVAYSGFEKDVDVDGVLTALAHKKSQIRMISILVLSYSCPIRM